MKKQIGIISAVIAVILFLFISGCNQHRSPAAISKVDYGTVKINNYSLGGCGAQYNPLGAVPVTVTPQGIMYPEVLEIFILGNDICIADHNMIATCGATGSWTEFEQADNVIKVYEVLDYGIAQANCICTYNFDTQIAGIVPGAEYTVEVYIKAKTYTMQPDYSYTPSWAIVLKQTKTVILQ